MILIGIEYATRVFKMKYKELAEIIGVSPPTINYWISGKKSIPEERLNQLSEIFDIPKSYFQKKINRVEMVDIEIAYYKKLSEKERYTVIETGFDYENEEYHFYEVEIDPYEHKRKYLEHRRSKEKLLLRTEQLLFFPEEQLVDGQDNSEELEIVMKNYSYMELLSHFNQIFEKGEYEHIDVLQVALESLCMFGNTPTIANNSKTKNLADDMKKLLLKYDIKTPIKF